MHQWGMEDAHLFSELFNIFLDARNIGHGDFSSRIDVVSDVGEGRVCLVILSVSPSIDRYYVGR